MRGNQEVDRAQYDEESDADYLPGCSILLPASVIPLIGLMPEEYFMYFEETDWCTRMKRKGVSLRYVPSSVIWHHFQDVKMDQAFSVYYYNRNERLFWYRYGSIQQRLSLIGRVIFKSLPSALRALYHAPSDEHVAVFTAHVHSCLDFLLGRFGKQRQVTR